MKTRRVTGHLHRMLVTASALVCVLGFVMTQQKVTYAGSGCKSKECTTTSGAGACNYNVDVEDCTCDNTEEEWTIPDSECEGGIAG